MITMAIIVTLVIVMMLPYRCESCVFVQLNAVAKVMKGKPDRPFGGVQIIFCGDFAQLRPIGDWVNGESLHRPAPPFAFESAAWKDANFLPVSLVMYEERSEFTGFQL